MSEMAFTIGEFIAELPDEWTGGAAQIADPNSLIEEVAIDSRRIHHPDKTMFVALKGENRDGHDFVYLAYERGVRCFLVEKWMEGLAGATQIVVEDSRRSLQQFARRYRERFSYPVIGITGSNGKTIVKEWLATVLEGNMRLVKSPQSYNSQLGVPLSLLGMQKKLDLAIIEAGISRPGEMEKLAGMIQPKWGVLTHFGDAHAEGFDSEAEKLKEKLKLFSNTDCVFVSADDALVIAALRSAHIPFQSIGQDEAADLRVREAHSDGNHWYFSIGDTGFVLPVTGRAALENALLVIQVAHHLGLEWETIRAKVACLHPVSMRMERITDNPEIAIINDAYNADRASVENAFSLLENERAHAGRRLILSDMEHQGQHQTAVQSELLAIAREKFGVANLILIGPIFRQLATAFSGLRAYPDIDAFLVDFDYDDFRHTTVLLKGARRYALERLIPYLSRRVTATTFKINMNHLVHNFRQFRALLPPSVKMMSMVKAFAYGSGTWEIAQVLEEEDIDYLAVAYTAEGIALRTQGIEVPIVIMNADPQNLEQLLHFRLEPNVFSLEFLRAYVHAGDLGGFASYPIHIKVDTGMRRLGFRQEDLPPLNAFLADHPKVAVRSVLSHLASADVPEMDAFTQAQIAAFQAFQQGLQVPDGTAPLFHILNTAGIVRFRDHAMDMVRLGIGLYGISPVAGLDLDLREVGSLHSVVTQVHSYPAHTPIGYGCSEYTQRASRIATVPIGYADGIRRSLSNGVGRFLVRGQRAPVMGRVCMDMLMLDVTDIPGVEAGDEVTLIGCQGKECISVEEIAQLCDTIPYEILTGISQRVRRVYVKE